MNAPTSDYGARAQRAYNQPRALPPPASRVTGTSRAEPLAGSSSGRSRPGEERANAWFSPDLSCGGVEPQPARALHRTLLAGLSQDRHVR